MNPSQTDSLEFVPFLWSLDGARPNPQSAPVHLTAQIMSPEPYRQYEGMLMAPSVQHGNARYLVLDLSAATETPNHVTGLTYRYQAFQSDLKVHPAHWRDLGDGQGPYLMCRPAKLQGYDTKPFWGWEVHQTTPGEGWYLMASQNVERRLATANQWADEIQHELVPRLQSRLKQIPSVLERCCRLHRARGRSCDEFLQPFNPNAGPINVTHGEIIRDNLVGMVADYWRSEFPQRDLEEVMSKLRQDIPRMERRLVQAQWLIKALRTLGTQPIEMERTMLHGERQCSLPVPIRPLAIAILNPVAPALHICTTPGIRPKPKGMRIGG